MPDQPRPSRFAVHAWALYDFASTAFSMNVISTYFALWVVNEHGGTDLTYGLAKSASMALVALVSPLAGNWSDRAGTRKPFLAVGIALYVALTLALGFTSSLGAGLLLFGLANVAFQLTNVFYNAMLPALVEPGKRGRLSGYGKALGYVGSLVAVLLGKFFMPGAFGLPGGAQSVFLPTALLVLAAALPLLLVRAPEAPAIAHRHVSWRQLVRDLRAGGGLPGVGVFLLASFFFFDTVNTIRDFMSLYMVNVVGLSATGGLQNFLLVVVLCSLVGAVVWGFVTDKLGPKPALLGVLALMAVGFVGLIAFHTPALVLGLIGPILGAAFGGVLVTTRPLLSALVPEDRQGEFFGLFILANDCAAILGPLTWGLTVAALKGTGALAYQAAVGVQLVFLLVGLALVTRVPAPARDSVPVAPLDGPPYDPSLER